MNTIQKTDLIKKIPVNELPYEKALAELEMIVKVMESEDNNLDESLLLYERGQALAKRCIELLDQAELKISQISGDQVIPMTQNE
jgi:exodeoxyribonuclease VII small subunit